MKITIDPGADWHQYQPDDLPDYEPLGVIHYGEAVGALLRRIDGRSEYYLSASATLIRLNARRVKAALGIASNAGRPNSTGEKSRYYNVRLGERHIAIARAIGGGNVSEGIRKALKKAVE